MLVALLLSLALGQDESGSIDEYIRPVRDVRAFRAGGRSGPGLAFLEFAPASGAGMTAACACATPKGARQETLTFARTSAAECISTDNQTITQCASGQPRVMSGDITDPVLGLLVEASRTNDAVQCHDLSQAAWTKSANMSCAKTATGLRGTANSASTCTTSAATQTVLQTIARASSTHQTSFYVRRRTGSGAVEVTANGGTNWYAITSSLTSSWKRVVPVEAVGCAGGGCIVVAGLGVTSANPTIGFRISTSGDAIDIDFAQNEVGAYPTTPIETTAAAATRNAESASIAFTAPTSANLSFDGVYVGPNAVPSFGTHWMMGVAVVFGNNFGTGGFRFYSGNAGSDLQPVWKYTSSIYFGGWANQSYSGARWGANAKGGTATTAGAKFSSPLYLGSDNGGVNPADGVIKQFRIDPDERRCRSQSVAALGDSITCCPSGAGNADGWPQYLQGTLRPRNIYVPNYAVYGVTATYARDTEWTLQAKLHGHDTIVVLVGTNDIFAGDSGAVVFGRIQTILDEARNAGKRVVPVTLLPRGASAGWTGAMQTALTDLNALIMAYCSTYSSSGVVCVDAYNSSLRTGTNLNATYDSGDGLHPNAAGTAYLAGLISAAL